MTRDNWIDCGNGVLLERGVPCKLEDGVTLYSDHYYPAESGPQPTLLMRQPYGRDIASTVVYAHPVWFASRGYNVVIQDVRGRGDSEGEFYPFRNEGRDGAETVRWLVSRPESNGKLGMYGFSYQGMTQLLAAAERPEGLICISPAMTAHDLYHGWFYHQGALRLSSSLSWGLQMLKADARRLGLRAASDALEEAWLSLPAQSLKAPYLEHPVLQREELPSYLRDWLAHDAPGPYWSQMDLSETVGRIEVPALHMAGWFDTYLQGSVDGFLELSAATSESARDHQYLLVGPWVHIPWGDRIGSHYFGPEAAFDTDAFLLRWLNHWLKDTGEFANEPKIRHFALGANRWCDASSWDSGTELTLYLHSNGRANSSKGDGHLSTEHPKSEEAVDVFVYDPEVPVLAPGGLGALRGPINQALLELGNNVLVYTSALLMEDIHVFGMPKLRLYSATSAPEADFVGKLIRISRDGSAEFVCIGVSRSTFQFPGRSYRPDTTHCWNFTFEPTSCLFAAGDAIRIEIASSAFPLYDRNSSTATRPGLASPWNWTRSTQFIFHTIDRPSAITLPIAAKML